MTQADVKVSIGGGQPTMGEVCNQSLDLLSETPLVFCLPASFPCASCSLVLVNLGNDFVGYLFQVGP